MKVRIFLAVVFVVYVLTSIILAFHTLSEAGRPVTDSIVWDTESEEWLTWEVQDGRVMASSWGVAENPLFQLRLHVRRSENVWFCGVIPSAQVTNERRLRATVLTKNYAGSNLCPVLLLAFAS